MLRTTDLHRELCSGYVSRQLLTFLRAMRPLRREIPREFEVRRETQLGGRSRLSGSTSAYGARRGAGRVARHGGYPRQHPTSAERANATGDFIEPDSGGQATAGSAHAVDAAFMMRWLTGCATTGSHAAQDIGQSRSSLRPD
jgi:hypothetical protein